MAKVLVNLLGSPLQYPNFVSFCPREKLFTNNLPQSNLNAASLFSRDVGPLRDVLVGVHAGSYVPGLWRKTTSLISKGAQ